ncbi:MAG: hypothetical protein QXO40_02425 [Candidatus Aenigmatarchaeota archaeon]
MENKLEDIDILERVEMLENVRKMINNIKSNEIEKLFLKKDCEDEIFELIFLLRVLQKNEEEGDVESYINNSTKLRELIEDNSKC